MQKQRKFELRAGLFLNLGLALVMIAVLMFGTTLNIFSKSSRYHFILPNAQGLVTGAKVLIAGLNAGKVSQMSLDSKNRSVHVDIQISRHFADSIRVDSFAELTTQGVLGDKIISIVPGSPDKPALPDGALIRTQTSTDLSLLFLKANTLLSHFDQLVLNIDQAVAGFGIKKSGKKISDVMDKINSILGKIDHGNGTLGALVNDPGVYDDTKALIGEVNSNRIVRNLVRKSINDSNEQAKTRQENEGREAGQGGAG